MKRIKLRYGTASVSNNISPKTIEALNKISEIVYNSITVKTTDMILTKAQKQQFKEASEPLIKYLAENHHPHVTVIVVNNRAEILESSATIINDDFILD